MSIGYANGWRQRILGIGRQYADVVNAARRGDASLGLVEVLGADEQPKSFAKALLRLAKALPEDVPAYRIANGTLYVPALKWGHHRGFHKPRTAELCWVPCWGIEPTKAA
jgi:hypothetical protein